MISLNAVKNIMRTVTKRPISARAVFILVSAVEESVKEKTKCAEELLTQRNELRKNQGLREKQRIDEELISEVLQRY